MHIYTYMYTPVQHALSFITIVTLLQLLHLGTLMYVYMLVAFEKPKSGQVTTRKYVTIPCR